MEIRQETGVFKRERKNCEYRHISILITSVSDNHFIIHE